MVLDTLHAFGLPLGKRGKHYISGLPCFSLSTSCISTCVACSPPASSLPSRGSRSHGIWEQRPEGNWQPEEGIRSLTHAWPNLVSLLHGCLWAFRGCSWCVPNKKRRGRSFPNTNC